VAAMPVIASNRAVMYSLFLICNSFVCDSSG
jgi:hypothetical protein